ncbi:MAG: hypothetical protein FDZ70_09830 [Actinobacteria bacterium]|nr:MAG: hypothetical protein FDZ70_09830 [Actinomycetota bacterium]
MPDILIRGVDPLVVEKLKERAAAEGTSLQAVAKRIIESSVPYSREEFLKVAAAERARTGPQKTDSTELIREDRDAR